MSSPLNSTRPGGHLVGRVAEQGVGQRRLARSVGPHEGVHLTGADHQVDAVQDPVALDGHVEVLDLEQGSHGSSVLPLRR